MLQVQCFTFNFIQENTYLIFDDQSREAVIIDAGNQFPKEDQLLFKTIADLELTVTRLLNTHAHIDHIIGNAACYEKYQLFPEIHPDEVFTFEKTLQTSMLWGIDLSLSPKPKSTLIANDFITLGNEKLEILFTPGHSQGHVSFYSCAQHMIFSGDVIFYNSIGRTDLPGGNIAILEHTIQKEIYTLPPQTIIYSGHGEKTTVKEEMQNNPFVRIT